jgi:hypothetical protein
MAYGTIKVDNIIFTNGGSDQTVTVSGIVASTSGNLTVTGTISGGTVKGTYGSFTSLTGVTTSGTNANFQTITGAVGVYTTSISGLAITGNTAGFTTVTGTTVTGTTANFVTLSGTTITGGTINVTTTNITSGIFAAGSAAAPSIAFTGDTDTGIYSPGANQVAISTNGQGCVYIDSAGRLSVGTSVAAQLLHVKNDAGSYTWARIDNQSSSASAYAGLMLGAFGNSWGMAIGSSAANSNALTFVIDAGGSNSEKMRLDSSGRLGLGTSSPAAKIEIAYTSTNPSLSTNTGAGLALAGNSTVQLNFGTNPASPYNAWIQARDTGTNSAFPIALNPLGGNVGIGTSSPGALLEAMVSRTSGTNTTALILNDNVTGAQTSGFGTRIEGRSNSNGAISAIGFEAFGGTNNDTGISFYTQITAGGLTRRMIIDSSGRVGIGTTGPGAKLHVAAGANVALQLDADTGLDTNIALSENGSIKWYFGNLGADDSFRFYDNTAATERLRIDSSGRLLVGTSTARSSFFNTSTFAPCLQLESTTSDGRLASIVFNENTTGSGWLLFGKTRGGSNGSNAIVSSGDSIGNISFQGADGSELVEAARITAEVDGTPGVNDMPGRLVFSVTADGAASPTERMRINSAGNVLINETTVYAACEGQLNITKNSGSTASPTLGLVNSSATAAYVSFSDSAVVYGSITRLSSTTVYNTTSDYRLKTVTGVVSDAGQRIDSLRPVEYTWNADGSHSRGFLAHEFQEVYAGSVSGTKDAVDAQGEPIYQAMQASTSEVIADLVAEIQSLRARVAALEIA